MKFLISMGILVVIVVMIFFALQGVMAQYHPVLIAQGEQIRLEAEQAALAAEQARAQQQAEWELQQAERKQISAVLVASYQAAIPWLAGIGTIAGMLLIGMFGLTIADTVRGVGQATVIAAHTAAHQVRLDPRTGQFPLYLEQGMLIDANTGMAIRTDQEHAADPRMIAAANSVRLSGVAVNNTRLSMLGNNLHAGPMVAGAMHPQLSRVENLLEADDYETVYGDFSGAQGSEPGEPDHII